MLNFKRKLNTFATVGVSQGATVSVAPGPTYQCFVLDYKRAGVAATEAQCKADITRVRIKINGTVRYECSGKHLIDCMNKYYGVGFTAGQLVIPLTRPWHKTIEGEENLGWGTKNVETMTIEVDIGATSVTPTLVGEAFFAPYARDLGQIIEVHEFTFQAAVGGPLEISTLPKSIGDLVALHFDSALATGVEVKINSVPAIEGDDLITKSILTWLSERTPQTDYLHVDALMRNRVDDAWPISAAREFMVYLTMSGAGAGSIVMETLNTPLAVSR